MRDRVSERPYRPVIIDCDPGIDDIVALVLAQRISTWDVLAITTVAGNTELANTSQNALRLTAFLGWEVPVARGATRPLLQPLMTARDVHGSDGLRGLKLPPTTRQFHELPAWDLIYQHAVAQAGALEIIAIGPLTNLAIAFAKYPDLPGLLRRIVVMGGGILAGNTTPAAEFNFFVDPEAAAAVLGRSEVPNGPPTTGAATCYLCPLDVTHQAYVTREDLAQISQLDQPVGANPPARLVADLLLGGYDVMAKYTGHRGVALHDPTAVLLAAHLDDATPGYFDLHKCFLGVETAGTFTRGKSVTDCYSDKKLTPNGFLVDGVDRQRFLAQVLALLAGGGSAG